MRYVVGYVAGRGGDEASGAGAETLALGAVLARAGGIELTLCTVLPETGRVPARVPAGPGYSQLLREQAEAWLAAARASLPAGAPVSTQVRVARSPAAGLVAAVEETGAALIVLGSAPTGLVRHFAVGSVASQLLHASPVPLALAPRGYAPPPGTAPRRVTCGYVATPGSKEALAAAVQLCLRNEIPLRLVTFVVPDAPLARVGAGDLERRAAEQGRAEAEEALSDALALLPAGLRAERAIVQAGDVAAAVGAVAWEDGDVLVLGSSPVGPVARVFLGPTSSRMLRHAPVPAIVVPREAEVSLETTAEHTVSTWEEGP